MRLLAIKNPSPGALAHWAWGWLQTHEKIRWTLIFIVVCTICYQINTGPVMASPEDETNASTLFLPLGGVTDTHGVPISRYTELPMDPGNATYILRSIRYTLASIFWSFYMLPVMLVIGLVEWILKFDWLNWLAAPFITVTEGVTGFLDMWMLIPLGLLVSALMIGIGYVRGRTGAATVEFIMVVLVFGLIASPVANPLTWVTGTGSDVAGSNGLIRQVADTGAQAGGMTINNEATSENTSVAGSIIDVTLRNPMLTMSFGSPLSGDCEATWNAEASDPSKSPDDIRKAVIKCDEGVAKANQTDGYVWLLHYLMAWPSMIGVMFLIAVFLGFLLYEVVQVLIGSVLSVIRSFLAVFPGQSRQAWLNSLFQVIISAMLVGVFIWALIVYMWVMTQVVASIPAPLIQVGSILTGILVLLMTFTFWKMRKSGKSIGERISKALGRTGLATNSPERQPSKFGSTVGNLAKSAVSKGIDVRQNRKLFNAANAARAAKVAATVGTGGVGAVAAKVGAGVVAKTASRKAIKAVAAQKAPLALGAGKGGMAGPKLPDGGAPIPMPSGKGSQMPSPEATMPTLPDGQENPREAVNVPLSSLSLKDHPPVEGTVHTPETAKGGTAETPLRDKKNVTDEHRTSRIPEGNYGGTWVHKNGQTHRPITVTQEGKPVRNVPTEEKITRGLRSGDAWVISPDIRPRSHSPAAATPSSSGTGPSSSSGSGRQFQAPARRSARQANTLAAAPIQQSRKVSESGVASAQRQTRTQWTTQEPATRSPSKPAGGELIKQVPAQRSQKSAGPTPAAQSAEPARPTPKPMKPRNNRGGSE